MKKTGRVLAVIIITVAVILAGSAVGVTALVKSSSHSSANPYNGPSQTQGIILSGSVNALARTRLPEDAERDCAEARAERQRLPTRVEDDADKQVVAQPGGEMAQPAEVFCPDCGPRFDLEGDHLPATVLQDEVDFDVVLGVVMVQLGALLRPG